MKVSKKFFKSSLIYTLAGALPMASAIILLPFYMGYLSTGDLGALSIYLVLTLAIQILTTYSFDISLYIHFHEYKNDREKLSSFTSSAFVLMLFIGACISLLLLIFGETFFAWIFPEETISFYPFGLMAVVTGVFQALFKVHSNFLQSREKPEIYLWSNVLSFSAIAGLTIVGLELYPNSLIGPIGARLIAAVIAGCWVLVRIFREFGMHFNYALLRESFGFNFYTFIYQLLQWVINHFDRIFMASFLVLSQVGIYDFAIKCLLAIDFILNGLHNSFYPKVVSAIMAQKTKRSVPEVNRYYHGFISVIMLLICVCILVFPWVITALSALVGKPEYQESIQYLPYIALIYIFRSVRMFYAAPYGILKYTKPLSIIYVVVSVVKIAVMWAAIGSYGLFGVVGASIVAAVVEIILLKYFLRHRFQFQYNRLKVIVAPLIIFVMIAALEPVFGRLIPDLVHVFYVLVCVGLLWWVYRNEIRLINPLNVIR